MTTALEALSVLRKESRMTISDTVHYGEIVREALTNLSPEGFSLGRYAVALFIRGDDGDVTKERLQLEIVEAQSADEAFGLVVRNTQRQFNNFPIVYHKTIGL